MQVGVLKSFVMALLRVFNLYIFIFGLAAQWLGLWICDWRSQIQSQPLHCRVLHSANCGHTFAAVTKQYNLVAAYAWA